MVLFLDYGLDKNRICDIYYKFYINLSFFRLLARFRLQMLLPMY